MPSVFVTTYHTDSDPCPTPWTGKHEDAAVFIRASSSHNEAWELALADAKDDLTHFVHDAGPRAVDCIEGEGDNPSFIRIINPNNGFEIHAYRITEHRV